MLELLREG
jgi:transposase